MVDLDLLTTVPPAQLVAALPAFLTDTISDRAIGEHAREALTREVAAWSASQARAVVEHLATLGATQRVYRADPYCRRVARSWSAHVLGAPTLTGAEHLAAALDAGPTVVVCNHLSYIDTLAADWALAHHGHEALADRIVTVAGPKVYARLFRRFAAASLNTLPVPQSTSVSTQGELPSPRELARLAHASLEAARDALRDGSAIQLYPEGARTRSGHLEPFLRGVHRYLAAPVQNVVPAAIQGTEVVFPFDVTRLAPAPIRLAFGTPIAVADVGGPREALALAHAAVAALLPAHLSPPPGAPAIR